MRLAPTSPNRSRFCDELPVYQAGNSSQNQRGWGLGGGFGGDVAGEGVFDGAEGAERVEGLDQPAVGLRFPSEENVDLSVEQQHHGAVFEIAHSHSLFHSDAGGDATHIADLEVEQDERRVDLCDRGNHVGTRPHSMDEVGAAQSGFDIVDKPVSVGSEKNVRHEGESYTSTGFGPMLGEAIGAAACGQ
ncbi:MAG: hypothetical protein ACI9C1_001537 [Candidatus Aldehydirespiratoraceae bacterium]|jgi:hypothetical protein